MACSNPANAAPKLLWPFFNPQRFLQRLKGSNIHASYNPPSSQSSIAGGQPPNISGSISLWLDRTIHPLPLFVRTREIMHKDSVATTVSLMCSLVSVEHEIKAVHALQLSPSNWVVM